MILVYYFNANRIFLHTSGVVSFTYLLPFTELSEYLECNVSPCSLIQRRGTFQWRINSSSPVNRLRAWTCQSSRHMESMSPYNEWQTTHLPTCILNNIALRATLLCQILRYIFSNYYTKYAQLLGSSACTERRVLEIKCTTKNGNGKKRFKGQKWSQN